MKKALKFTLFIIAGLILGVLIMGLIAPKEFKVERTAFINAPQELVMSQINNLKVMNEWSPWSEYDPEMKTVYAGIDGQVGSTSSWNSEELGNGTQEITLVTENRVETKLQLSEWNPSKAYFQLNNNTGLTSITWGMEGEMPFPWNAFSLFNSMDNMLGKDYEKGLNKLKSRCESMAKIQPANNKSN